MKVVLTDIEGTTSSIAFVKEVLFPYATEHLPAFLAEQGATPEVSPWLEAVRAEIEKPKASPEELVSVLQGWIQEDRKATPLKALQGLLWKRGYEEGHYRAHVYPDAHPCLQAWHAEGVPLYVYSSGSVAAQKLFFGHCDFGDLRPLFSGYFDTTTGPKREAASYRQIVAEIGVPAGEVVFLSDVEEELDAAREAGLQTRWVVREGPLPEASAHPVARSFNELAL